MTVSSPMGRSISKAEKKLGFRFGRGIGKGNKTVPVLRDFVSELDDMKTRFATYTPVRLNSSPEFERQCELFFEAHADALWPPASVNRSKWLVDARIDNLDGLYQENLYANDERERKILWFNFREMVLLKICAHRYNHPDRHRETTTDNRVLDENINVSRGRNTTSSAVISEFLDDQSPKNPFSGNLNRTQVSLPDEVFSSPAVQSRKHARSADPHDERLLNKAPKTGQRAPTSWTHISTGTQSMLASERSAELLSNAISAVHEESQDADMLSTSGVMQHMVPGDYPVTIHQTPSVDQEHFTCEVPHGEAGEAGANDPQVGELQRSEPWNMAYVPLTEDNEESRAINGVGNNPSSSAVTEVVVNIPRVDEGYPSHPVSEIDPHKEWTPPHEMIDVDVIPNVHDPPDRNVGIGDEVKRHKSGIATFKAAGTGRYVSPASTPPSISESQANSVVSEARSSRGPALWEDAGHSALERAIVSVHWELKTKVPSFIVLHRCKTYEDFFGQLHHKRPTRFEDRTIKAVEVILTNAEAAGFIESPNCHMLEEEAEGAFNYLIAALEEVKPEVRPKLKVMVEFWE